MKDLISRQAAIDAVRNIRAITGTEDDSILLIDKAEVQTELMMLPTAQTERPKGEWIRKKELEPLPWDWLPLHGDDYDAATHSVWKEYYHCSNCDWKSGAFKGDNFCPKCGADMRGEKDG